MTKDTATDGVPNNKEHARDNVIIINRVVKAAIVDSEYRNRVIG